MTGFTYNDACEMLGVNARTCQRWRTDLCREASLYFGRTVSYEFAAQWVLDAGFRALFEEQMQRAQGSAAAQQARSSSQNIPTSASSTSSASSANLSASFARNRSNGH